MHGTLKSIFCWDASLQGFLQGMLAFSDNSPPPQDTWREQGAIMQHSRRKPCHSNGSTQSCTLCTFTLQSHVHYVRLHSNLMYIICIFRLQSHVHYICLHSNLVTNCSAIESERVLCNEASILHIIGGVVYVGFFSRLSVSSSQPPLLILCVFVWVTLLLLLLVLLKANCF